MANQRKAGVLLGYANILVKNLVNLVYTPMLLAFVGQADYGVFQTSNSFVLSLSLLSFGFSEAYVRFYTQKKTHGTDADIRSLNGMYLLLYGVVCTLALLVGFTFSTNAGLVFSGSFTPQQVDLAVVLMSIMTVNVTATLLSTVFDAYILAHEQFRFQQTRQMFTTLVTPGVAFGLLSLGMGAVGVALAQLVVGLTLLALNARYAIGKLGMRFDVRRFDKGLFRAVAAFSTWIFANQLCELANQSIPNVVVGALSGATVVAVFAISVQIRSVFYSLSLAISSVFVPLINRIVAESDDNGILTRLMTRVGRLQAILYVWVLGGFILVGRFFVSKWAGEAFSAAYWLVIVMAAPLIIPLTQNTGIEIQRAKNKHKARSIAYLAMALVNVTLTAALARPLGYWAPAVGYVVYIILGSGFFMNWYYQKRIGLDMAFFWRRILPVLTAGAAVTGVCLLGCGVVPVSGWGRFIGWGVLYTLIYVLVTYLLVMSREERSSIARRFGRFGRR